MNKTELINRVSEMSQVDITDCKRVINALEKVMEGELESSQGPLNAFDKFYKLINSFRKN